MGDSFLLNYFKTGEQQRKLKYQPVKIINNQQK
jgi:hypothetical protein